VHGQLRNKFGHVLRVKLTAGFASVGGVVGDKKLVSITEKIDVTPLKIAKI
jgi:hypothetical protein